MSFPSPAAIRFAIRVSKKDKRTCKACWDLDGSVVVIGSKEHKALHPPAGCLHVDGPEGGCRCSYMTTAASPDQPIVDAPDLI